jgi:hypothetical protein
MVMMVNAEKILMNLLKPLFSTTVIGYFGDTVPVISRDIVPLSTSKDRDKD